MFLLCSYGCNWLHKKGQLKTQQEPSGGTWMNQAVHVNRNDLKSGFSRCWFCCFLAAAAQCGTRLAGFRAVSAQLFIKRTHLKSIFVSLCFCRARPRSGGSRPAALHLGPGGDGPLQQQTQTEAGPPQPGSRCADITQPKPVTQRGRLSRYNHCKDSEAFGRHIDTHLYPACQSCLYSLWVSRRAPYLDGTSRCG